MWQFEPDARSPPIVLDQASLMQLSGSAQSKAMSKDLRRRGWLFVGPTTVYAFMEAIGLSTTTSTDAPSARRLNGNAAPSNDRR